MSIQHRPLDRSIDEIRLLANQAYDGTHSTVGDELASFGGYKMDSAMKRSQLAGDTIQGIDYPGAVNIHGATTL
jgi:hypothetical protein